MKFFPDFQLAPDILIRLAICLIPDSTAPEPIEQMPLIEKNS